VKGINKPIVKTVSVALNKGSKPRNLAPPEDATGQT
jgi:hypothetical protein